MLWKDAHALRGQRVKVWADSTPDSPILGEGPYIGVVRCPGPEQVPVLRIGDVLHAFADWWQVEPVGSGEGGLPLDDTGIGRPPGPDTEPSEGGADDGRRR